MLASGTWLLLSIISILISIYAFVKAFSRKWRPGEPPLVGGHLIWGSAADFSKHAVSFLHQCRRSHGDVFTIRLLNQYLTVIMDPHSYDAMSRTRTFDFDPIQRQVNSNVFSFQLKEPKDMIKETGRTVRGAHLDRSMLSFAQNLQIAYDRVSPAGRNGGDRNSSDCTTNGVECDDAEWNSDGLRHFASRTLFDALFNSIFGREPTAVPKAASASFNPPNIYKNFETFHKYFNYLWLGLPKGLFPEACRSLEELSKQPCADELLQRDDVSEYVQTAINYMKTQGQTESDIMNHNLVYLHVNYNTFRVAFWALSYILEDATARWALISEIDRAVEERLDETGDRATFTVRDVESLKILDSIVQETMRLSSGVFMVRYITEDTMFATSTGEEFLMRKGDRVAMYPPATHKDPEIFHDPLVFKYDRFVDAKFYKSGQLLRQPVMAFGTICPGKRYALLQLKWFLLTVLTRFELSLREGQRAEYDYQYHGHEIIPPVSDVQIDFRPRPHSTRQAPPTLLLSDS